MNEAAKKVIDVTKAHLTEGESDFMKLPDNPIDSFRNGACLDLRVKMAIELLTHSPLFGGLEGELPKDNAAYALDVATELFNQAEARGLLYPLDSSDMWARLEQHIKRQVSFQLQMAKETQRQQEQGIHVGRAVASAFGKPN